MLLSLSVILILLLGFGEAKKQKIYQDEDERPSCPCRIYRPRIVGGSNADKYTFPYSSYIIVGDHVTTCGATLISDRHVLTSAHCLDKVTRLDQVKVHVGHYDHRVEPKYLRRPKSIVPYQDYNPVTFIHDIALVEFTEAVETNQDKHGQVTWSHGVQAAVLPAPGLKIEPGIAVTLYGWGILDNDHSDPSVLQSVEMRVVENGRCQESFGISMEDSMLCAGGVKGQGACSGDSVGGLVVPLLNDYVLCGVVSYGQLRCPQDYKVPVVYTRVSSYVDWIYNNTMSSGCKPCISKIGRAY